MNNIEKAVMVSAKAHEGQSYDIYPYTYHCLMVGEIATQLGYDESIVVSCLLHDTLEDSDLSYNDIKNTFGEEVAEIVYCVTDELGRNRTERKMKTYPKIRSNVKATIVKICDRIGNITHSKTNNSKMYNLYKKENELFHAELIKDFDNPDVNKAWDKLKTIFDE